MSRLSPARPKDPRWGRTSRRRSPGRSRRISRVCLALVILVTIVVLVLVALGILPRHSRTRRL